DIASDVSAYLDHATVKALQGNVEIAATASGTIDAIAVAASIAIANGKSSSGVSVAGGGAVSLNSVRTNVKAYGQNSSITAGKDVTLNAEDDSRITSTIVTVAASGNSGQTSG